MSSWYWNCDFGYIIVFWFEGIVVLFIEVKVEVNSLFMFIYYSIYGVVAGFYWLIVNFYIFEKSDFGGFIGVDMLYFIVFY